MRSLRVYVLSSFPFCSRSHRPSNPWRHAPICFLRFPLPLINEPAHTLVWPLKRRRHRCVFHLIAICFHRRRRSHRSRSMYRQCNRLCRLYRRRHRCHRRPTRRGWCSLIRRNGLSPGHSRHKLAPCLCRLRAGIVAIRYRG